MTPVYAFALIVGAPLLLWQIFGGGDFEADSDGRFTVVPITTVAFILTFFGALGLTIQWLDSATTFVGFVIAAVVGLLAGGFNSGILAYLGRTGMSSDISNREIEGSLASVSLPMSPNRRGRIQLKVAEARTMMTAEPYDPKEGDIEQGETVIVVSIRDGVALVARFDAPELDSSL